MNAAVDEPRKRAPAPPRAGCFGRSVRAALGIAAFLAGGAVMAGFAGPRLLSARAKALVEEAFERRFAGRLDVGRVDFNWTGRTVLRDARLRDPDGGTVGRLNVRLPGGLDLLGALEDAPPGGPVRLSFARVQGELHVVADADGVTNVERALAPRNGARFDELFSSRVTLALDRVTWTDPETQRTGEEVEWERVNAVLLALPDVWTLSVEQESRAGAPRLSVRWRQEREPTPGRAPAHWPWGPITGEVHLESAWTGAVDACVGAGGRLRAAFGRYMDVHAELEDIDGRAGRLSLGLQGQGSNLSLSGGIEDGLFVAPAGKPGGLSADVVLDAPWLEEVLADVLPDAASLEVGAEPVSVSATDLSVPIVPLLAPVLERESGGRLWSVLGGHVEVRVPQLRYRDEEAPVDDRVVDVADVLLTAELAAGGPSSVELGARVGAGALGATLESPAGLGALLAEPGRSEPSRLSVTATGISTALGDRLSGTTGLLEDTFGHDVNATLTVHGHPRGAWSKLHVTSKRSDLRFEGRWTPEGLSCGGSQELVLEGSPGPQFYARCLQPLLPLTRDLAPVGPDGRLRLRMRELVLSTDAGSAGFSGELNVSLPEIEYRIPQGIERLYGHQASQARHRDHPPSFDVQVARGMANFEALVVRAADSEQTYAGRVDLVEGTLDFKTRVPLSFFGGHVVKAVKVAVESSVGGFSPSSVVPVQILGPCNDPRVKARVDLLGKDLANVWESALNADLIKGLQGLMDLGQQR